MRIGNMTIEIKKKHLRMRNLGNRQWKKTIEKSSRKGKMEIIFYFTCKCANISCPRLQIVHAAHCHLYVSQFQEASFFQAKNAHLYSFFPIFPKSPFSLYSFPPIFPKTPIFHTPISPHFSQVYTQNGKNFRLTGKLTVLVSSGPCTLS